MLDMENRDVFTPTDLPWPIEWWCRLNRKHVLDMQGHPQLAEVSSALEQVVDSGSLAIVSQIVNAWP